MDARITQTLTKRLHGLSDALWHLHEAQSSEEVAHRALAVVDSAFPEAFITFNVIGRRPSDYHAMVNRPVSGFAAVMAEIATCVANDHPVIVRQRETGKPETLVARISDFVTHRQFANTQLFSVGFRPFGCFAQLADAILAGDRYVGIGIQRDRDFDDDEVKLQEVLHAHLQRAFSRHWVEPAVLRLGVSNLVEEGNLTARESEVLHWIREGKRNSEIAIILGCSRGTVKVHCENIYRKLGVETRTAAARASRP